MPARDDKDREPELTAQPKTLPEELGTTPITESGLSVDPEDLGRQFLSDAIEQGNFESQRGGEAAELWLSSNPPSDDALTGPNFEADHDVWETTAGLVMQSGSADEAQEAASTAPPSSEELPAAERDEDDELDLEADLDLSEPVIQEASLLDREGDEPGETEAPGLSTDDSHSHAKRRGGHALRRGRPGARAR